MKYYRANCEAHDLRTFCDLIQGELLTKRERAEQFPSLSDKCFDTVEIKKTETYKFFGVRFCDENAQVIVYKEGVCLR